jgi:hypothetical protein
MDLGLPPPPGAQTLGPRSGKEKRAIVIILVLITGLGLCACGGFAGFFSFAMGQATGPVAEQVRPWLDQLVAEDYKGAAAGTGKGVKEDDLRAAVERRIGAPLKSYEVMKGSARVKMDPANDSGSFVISYKLTGSRSEATVEIEVIGDASPSRRTIRIPSWGITPEPVRRHFGSESGESAGRPGDAHTPGAGGPAKAEREPGSWKP